MNGRGKSDRPVVPGKSPNNGGGAPRPAEGMEERGLAKGNSRQQTRHRAQHRDRLQQALTRVRQAACKIRSSACASDPRQEPSAVVPHAGICAGGGPQGPSLPRQNVLAVSI